MISKSVKNDIHTIHLKILIFIYKNDLALNNQQWLIAIKMNKQKQNQTEPTIN